MQKGIGITKGKLGVASAFFIWTSVCADAQREVRKWSVERGNITEFIISISVILLLFLPACASNSKADRWLGNWDCRIKLTIDSNKVDDALSHLPVLIHLGSSSGNNSANMTQVFDEVCGNSTRIAVTEADGVTQLYVEVEKWDAATEEAWLWVSSSNWTVSSTEDTSLYLYYDNSQPDNTTYVGNPGSVAAESV
ncbi:hypothetical protein ACFLWS_01235 [Chloroflexota bacterium]